MVSFVAIRIVWMGLRMARIVITCKNASVVDMVIQMARTISRKLRMVARMVKIFKMVKVVRMVRIVIKMKKLIV